jgi:hypothetical protein
MPGIDHLRIGGNCFFLKKRSLALQFEPRSIVLLVTFLHHLIEGKKNKLKCGVQVKHFGLVCKVVVKVQSSSILFTYMGDSHEKNKRAKLLFWFNLQGGCGG